MCYIGCGKRCPNLYPFLEAKVPDAEMRLASCERRLDDLFEMMKKVADTLDGIHAWMQTQNSINAINLLAKPHA